MPFKSPSLPVLAVLALSALAGCPSGAEEEPLPPCLSRAELTDADFVGGLVLEAGSCWVVNERLTLDDGTVTVEDGVSIWFGTDIGVEVSSGGTLSINGTEANPVELTSTDPLVTWRGIELSDSQGVDNAWSYVLIENGGSDNWTGAAYSGAAVYLTGQTTLSMDSVIIRGSQSHGLVALGEVDLVATGTAFEGNVTPAFLHPGGVGALGPETVFSNNSEPWVSVGFGNTDRITQPTTWHALAVPIRVQDRFSIESDWSLDPGTVVEVEQDVSIQLEQSGALFAEGSADAPIVFRGASAGTRGYWKGIEIQSGGTDDPISYGAVFDYVEIADAGSDNWNGNSDSIAAVFMNSTSSALFTNTRFRNSGRYGLWASAEARIDGFADNLFEGNARVMRLHPERVGELSGTSVYTGNEEDRVHVGLNNNDTVTAAASWKDLGVPYELSERFYIAADVDIEAGTILEAAQDVDIIVEVDGSLGGGGTADAPIVFRGVNPVSTGYWKGIEIQSNDTLNQFSGLELLHAGSDAWFGGPDATGSIYLAGGASLSLIDSTISSGNSYGIIIRDDALLSCTSVDLSDTDGVFSTQTDTASPGC